MKRTLMNINILYIIGSPPLSSQVPVRLKVVDRSQPIFDRQFYSATVAEDADSHTPVVTVTAHSQLNRKLIYTIVGGNEHQTFAMEHEEGRYSVFSIFYNFDHYFVI